MFPQGVLVPPENFQVNQTAQDWVTFGQFVPLTAMLACTIWFIVRRGNPIPLFCMAGGAVAMLVEPNIDVLAGCWLGDVEHGQRAMFDTLGHSFPLWGVAYIWYYGGQAFLVYWLLGRTGTGRQRAMLWRMFGLALLTDAMIELPALQLGVYTYYGPQPMVVLGLPLHWEPINAAIPVAAGTVVYVLRRQLAGMKALLTVPIVAVVHGGVMMTSLVPVTVAMGWGDGPPAGWIVTAAALVTMSFAILCAWLATQLVPRGGLHDQKRSEQVSLLDPAHAS